MKVRYICGILKKEVAIESDFVPLVGDRVSLIGCQGVPNEIQMSNWEVVCRSYSLLNDSILINLKRE